MLINFAHIHLGYVNGIGATLEKKSESFNHSNDLKPKQKLYHNKISYAIEDDKE